jgi:carbamoyl-phosphate synthase large subunit
LSGLLQKKSEKMIRILVTGVGSLLGQGILKSIQEFRQKSYVVGTDYFPSAVGLYWVDSGYILPDILKQDINEEEWLNCLVEIIVKEKIDIVLPGLDFEIPILSKHKSFIEEKTGTIVLVSSEEVVKVGNDKWETVNYLKNNRFNYPDSTLPENLDEFIGKNPFPYIVKPRFGHTSENVFLVKNDLELRNAIQSCDKPIIQEYISNADQEYTCGASYLHGEVLTLICLRRTLKNGNTQLAFSEKTDQIDEYINTITRAIKPYGPINFQLRLSERGPVIFEINPRFSGTTPIRALFGVNEVLTVIEVAMETGLKVEYRKKEGVVIRYFENQFIPWEKYQVYS